MESFIKDESIFIKSENKAFKLISQEDLERLYRKEGFVKKINELSFRYLSMVSSEIAKMDLEENEKILAETLVIQKLMEGLEFSMGKMCEKIGSNFEGDIKDDNEEALRCFNKVMKSVTDKMVGYRNEIRPDIKGDMRDILDDISTQRRKSSDILLDVCKRGEGKNFSIFVDEVMTKCIKEINRLGRHLTKDEIMEICSDVKLNRR